MCKIILALIVCFNTSLFAMDYYETKVVFQIKHSENSFTQGLFYKDGSLYESNGVKGSSSLQVINPENGRVLKYQAVPRYFCEGLTWHDGQIYQLTWQARKGFVYKEDFEVMDTFFYEREGWGLTSDSSRLIMSDGSNVLYFIDPKGFKIVDEIPVYFRGSPLYQLNELEYVDGIVYANIYMTDMIAMISVARRELIGLIDASSLKRQLKKRPKNVLNGIAYNKDKGFFYLTGKYWPKIFAVKFAKIN